MKVGFQHVGTVHIALKAFIENLGCEVVLGPHPNKRSLDIGVQYAPELVCVPFKIMLGNLVQVLEKGVDTVAFLGGGDWSCRFGYYGRLQCAILRRLGYKFDAIFVSNQDARSVVRKVLGLNHNSWIRTLSYALYGFTLAWHKSKLVELAERSARETRAVELTKGESSRLLSTVLAEIDNEDSINEVRRMSKRIKNGFSQIQVDTTVTPLRIQIVGESYCVFEPFVNFELIEQLGNRGVLVEPTLTSHRWLFHHALRKEENPYFPRKEAKALARPFWAYETGGEDMESIGYTINAARQGFDGVIHLMPFSCMPETAALPVLERVSQIYHIPFLNLSLDEHTGATGFYSRVEAFLDIVSQRSREKTNKSE